jgi:hypothetical protein
MSLPVITNRNHVLYYVTIFDFPKSTLRHQVAVGDTMEERIITFDEWLELEAKRIAGPTGMSFGVVHDNQGQMALAALRVHAVL